MNTILILLAAFSYGSAGYLMKLSNGMTNWRPTVLVLILFSLGACIQMYSMRDSALSVNYLVVLGLEAMTALCFALFLLGESFSLGKLLGAITILIGVAILRA